MRVNQLKMGVIFNYAAQGVSILTGLLYTPIMLRVLGQSEYGLYQLVYSVVSYLGLLSLGFGSGYVRFYARYKTEGDSLQIDRLNGMYFSVFSLIAAVCIACGCIMIFNVKAIFGTGLTDAELGKARILLALMVVNVALSFLNTVFENNITVHERFLFNRGLNFAHLLLSPLVTLPLLFLGMGSVAIVSVNLGFAFAVLIVNIFYCLKKLKMRFSFRNVDFGLVKEIAVFTFYVFILMMVDRINLSIGKVLLGRMVGTVAVAIFGVASQINILYVNFSTAISQMFIPRVNMIAAKANGDKELSDLFARVGRIQFLVLALIVSGYTLFGKEFMLIWAGAGYEGSYYVGLFLMIPPTVSLIQNLGVEIQKAKNMHKVCAFANLFAAIANVIISIPLVQKYSYFGAAAGTAISIVASSIFTNWYYHARLGMDIKHFWKEIGKLFPALIVCVAGGLLIKQMTCVGTGIISLAVKILLYVLVYAVVFWMIGMNSSEKNLISGPLKMIITKIKRNPK